MKQTFFLAGALAALTLGAGAQPTPDNHLAEPGVRVGRVFIGDSKAAVGRRLGAASRSFSFSHGLSSQVWRSKKRNDTGRPNTLEVVYQNGVVRQIEGTSLVWKTPDDVSLASSRSEWEDAYGKPLVSTYDFDGGTRKRYLDWKAKGIAVELVSAPREADDAPDNWTYQTLIVHRKGNAVLPDRGGVLE